VEGIVKRVIELENFILQSKKVDTKNPNVGTTLSSKPSGNIKYCNYHKISTHNNSDCVAQKGKNINKKIGQSLKQVIV
ncbi:hypothetical protein H311_00376, partial [Anncaliia algerae PRA109]